MKAFFRGVARRPWLVCFVGVTLVYLATPVRYDSDNVFAFATASSIVHHQTLDISGAQSFGGAGALQPGPAGILNFFPWTVALFAVPAVVIADIGQLVGIGSGAEGRVADGLYLAYLTQPTTALASAGTVILLAACAHSLVPAGSRRVVGLSVGFAVAFGTPVWSIGTTSLNQHGPALLLLAAGMFLAIRLVTDGARGTGWNWRATLVGACLAASYTLRPTTALIALAVALWFGLCQRRLLGHAVAGAASIVGPWLLVTHIAYGTSLQPYYGMRRLTFHPSVLEALAGNLVSPSRGLLTYSPLLMCLAAIGVATTIRRAASLPRAIALLHGLLAGSVVLTWIAVSLFPHWWGGYSYGPRLLTETVAPLAILAVPAVQRLTTPVEAHRIVRPVTVACLAVLALWSGLVHGQGALFGESICWNSKTDLEVAATPSETWTTPAPLWSWSDPQFFAGIRSVPQLSLSDFVRGRCP